MKPGKIQHGDYKWAQCGRCEYHEVISPEGPRLTSAIYEREARSRGWVKTRSDGWICLTCAQAQAGAGSEGPGEGA